MSDCFCCAQFALSLSTYCKKNKFWEKSIERDYTIDHDAYVWSPVLQGISLSDSGFRLASPCLKVVRKDMIKKIGERERDEIILINKRERETEMRLKGLHIGIAVLCVISLYRLFLSPSLLPSTLNFGCKPVRGLIDDASRNETLEQSSSSRLESSFEARFEPNVRDVKSTRLGRDDHLPLYFAGLSATDKYPVEGFSLEKLKLCHAALGGPYTEDKLHKCTEDPTCVSCIPKELFTQVNPLVNAHWDKVKQRKRRSQFRAWFGDPRAATEDGKSTTIINVLAADARTAHMAFNWACAAHRVRPGVVERLLLVPSEMTDYENFMKAGLHSVDPSLMYETSEKLPFKTNGFRWAMSMLILTAAELVDMGYDVLIQDADVGWYRDPIPELETDPTIANLDMMFQTGVRFDAQGPSNTGVVYIRSNKKTRLFLNSMVNAVVMVYHMFDDQRFWNNMLRHYWFSQLHWTLLPKSIVLGMFQSIKHWSKSRLRRANPAIIHRVGNQGGKIALGKALDLKAVGVWHFTEACPIAKPSKVLSRVALDEIVKAGLDKAASEEEGEEEEQVEEEEDGDEN